MRKVTPAVLVALALASVLLVAQTPPRPPDPATMAAHRVDFLTTVLNLTPAQQKQATTIFTNAATATASVRDSLKSTHQSLSTAIAGNNGAAIDQASHTIGSLVSQMTSINAKANAAFYQILTPDQQSKLTKLRSEHGPGMHRGGHGHGCHCRDDHEEHGPGMHHGGPDGPHGPGGPDDGFDMPF